eukprot:Rhum_TRINITY_DN14853_c1_g2::Rhum_TRINITY_DN14853_c1_g2_i1::g.119780::m.119780
MDPNDSLDSISSLVSRTSDEHVLWAPRKSQKSTSRRALNLLDHNRCSDVPSSLLSKGGGSGGGGGALNFDGSLSDDDTRVAEAPVEPRQRKRSYRSAFDMTDMMAELDTSVEGEDRRHTLRPTRFSTGPAGPMYVPAEHSSSTVLNIPISLASSERHIAKKRRTISSVRCTAPCTPTPAPRQSSAADLAQVDTPPSQTRIHPPPCLAVSPDTRMDVDEDATPYCDDVSPPRMLGHSGFGMQACSPRRRRPGSFQDIL